MGIVLGITGGIGAGKSTLAAALGRRGARVHDADGIGRFVVDENAELREALRIGFGDDFLPGGRLDRAALGRRVFADPVELERLNRMVLPYLLSELRRRIAEGAGEALQVVDAALLHEWGVEAEFDEIWVVAAADERRIARAMARLGLGRDEAEARLARQLPQDELCRRADRVLWNDGSLQQLEAWLDIEWKRLTEAGRAFVQRKDGA